MILWDAGTEVNQAPGFGSEQAPRQGGADTGTAENGVVQAVADGFTYPIYSRSRSGDHYRREVDLRFPNEK